MALVGQRQPMLDNVVLTCRVPESRSSGAIRMQAREVERGDLRAVNGVREDRM